MANLGVTKDATEAGYCERAPMSSLLYPGIMGGITLFPKQWRKVTFFLGLHVTRAKAESSGLHCRQLTGWLLAGRALIPA